MKKNIIKLKFGKTVADYYQRCFENLPNDKLKNIPLKIFHYVWKNRENILYRKDSLIGHGAKVPAGAQIILYYINHPKLIMKKEIPYFLEIDSVKEDVKLESLTQDEYLEFTRFCEQVESKQHLSKYKEFINEINIVDGMEKSLNYMTVQFDDKLPIASLKTAYSYEELERKIWLSNFIYLNIEGEIKMIYNAWLTIPPIMLVTQSEHFFSHSCYKKTWWSKPKDSDQTGRNRRTQDQTEPVKDEKPK